MIRGLHFQADPKPKAQLIRCATGAIWDVIVDLRRHSPTFGRWESFELSGQNRRCLYGRVSTRISMSGGEQRGFYQTFECYFPHLARVDCVGTTAIGHSLARTFPHLPT